jgi:hypothetical protein
LPFGCAAADPTQSGCPTTIPIFAARLQIGSAAAMAEVAYPRSEEEIEALAHYLAHL